jgi:hypothetical protein
MDPQNVRRVGSLVRVQMEWPDVTKLELHLEISIAIDRARRNDLTVATVTQKDLSLAVDVVCSASVSARAPIIRVQFNML